MQTGENVRAWTEQNSFKLTRTCSVIHNGRGRHLTFINHCGLQWILTGAKYSSWRAQNITNMTRYLKTHRNIYKLSVSFRVVTNYAWLPDITGKKLCSMLYRPDDAAYIPNKGNRKSLDIFAISYTFYLQFIWAKTIAKSKDTHSVDLNCLTAQIHC